MCVRACVSMCVHVCVCERERLCVSVCYFRHWQKLSEELGMNIQPKPTFTFNKCLEMGLDSHVDAIAKVADIAGKEFSIEQVQYATNNTFNNILSYVHLSIKTLLK